MSRYLAIKPRDYCCLLSIVVVGAALLGCQEEPEIRHYTAPRVQRHSVGVRPQDAGSPDASSGQMLLGAMTWVQGAGWFFRTIGPKDQVEAQKPAFLDFLRSLELTPEQARWQLPPGWQQEERSRPERYATLRMGTGTSALELAIFRFPPGQGGDVAGNVNRWRGMVGLPPITPREAEGLAQRLKTPQHEFFIVELTGPGKPR